MGTTITLDQAFRIVKDRFGDDLAGEGATDDEIKKYLTDLASIDSYDYLEATGLWRLMRMDISVTCAQMRQTVLQQALTNCLKDYAREGMYEEQSKCVEDWDKAYERCLGEKKKYNEKIAKIEASMGSRDKKTISRYDLDNIRLISLSIYNFNMSVPEALRPFHSQMVAALMGELSG